MTTWTTSHSTFPIEIQSLILRNHKPILELGVGDQYKKSLQRFRKETSFASQLCLVNTTFCSIMKPLMYTTFLVMVDEDELKAKTPAIQLHHHWITRLVLYGLLDEYSLGGAWPNYNIKDLLSLCENLKTLELVDFHLVYPRANDDDDYALTHEFLSSITSTHLTTLSILTRLFPIDPDDDSADSDAPILVLHLLPKAIAGRLEVLTIDYWTYSYVYISQPPREIFASLLRLELLQVDLTEEFPVRLMKGLTALSPPLSEESTTAKSAVGPRTPPIREIHLWRASQEFSGIFLADILSINNLGMGLRYLYISLFTANLLTSEDEESLSSFPTFISQHCTNLEVLLYFVPCPAPFLNNLPIRLKKLGVLLSSYDPEDFNGIPGMRTDLVIDWANSVERRKEVKEVVIACSENRQDRLEVMKTFEREVKDVQVDFVTDF